MASTTLRTKPLMRVAHHVVLSWGWRRALIAFGAGAISVMAMAPTDLWPMMFLTFPVLVWLIDGAAGRLGGLPNAFVAGWWFGFGYFFAGLYWMGHAFLVDAKTFGWMLPFAVTAVPAALALITGFGVAFARAIWVRGPFRILSLAVALTGAEWLRGHLFTGFPWNTYGYALTGPLVLAQSAALIGIWGLTFIAVAVFSSPALLADDHADTRRPALPLIIGVAVLCLMTAYGALRLAKTPMQFVDDVRLRIMQPNLQQDEKFNYMARQEVMKRYLALSDRSTGPQSTGIRDITHLIWPESAFPFFLTREAEALAQIGELLPKGAVLITGAVRAPEPVPGQPMMHAYNSIYVIDHDGAVLSVYDKVHLVPFGEYLPFQNFLERLGLQQITKVQGGFIPGTRRRALDVPRAPRFLPLICYEIIFPGEAVPRGERPGWLVNVTNDGWFGISSGPYQHLQQARVRAIEEGLPLVRAANTGVSAVIDPLGRTVRSLPLGVEGVLDSQLPQPIEPTVYVRTGDGLAGLLVGAALVLVLRRRVRQF
jgi:apolipoprotein N-acyltransferase